MPAKTALALPQKDAPFDQTSSVDEEGYLGDIEDGDKACDNPIATRSPLNARQQKIKALKAQLAAEPHAASIGSAPSVWDKIVYFFNSDPAPLVPNSLAHTVAPSGFGQNIAFSLSKPAQPEASVVPTAVIPQQQTPKR